jgi:hypothetical protein
MSASRTLTVPLGDGTQEEIETWPVPGVPGLALTRPFPTRGGRPPKRGTYRVTHKASGYAFPGVYHASRETLTRLLQETCGGTDWTVDLETARRQCEAAWKTFYARARALRTYDLY